MNTKKNPLKHALFLIVLFFALLSKAQIGRSTEFEKRIDSSLVNSVFFVPNENAFTPKFYGINGGLNQFSVQPLLMDYGWYSSLFSDSYEELSFVSDSIPSFEARYDYGMSLTHWFGVDFYRPVGESSLFLKFNRNFSDPLYDNTEVESANLVLGSAIQFHKNYTMSVGYFRNQAVKSESGGIASIEEYKSAEVLNDLSVSTLLGTAKNDVFNNGLIVNQNIVLKTNTDTSGVPRSEFGVRVNSKIEEHRYTFSMGETDIDSGYFNNVFLDTTNTFDSIGFRKVVIRPSLYWLAVDTSKSFEIGYEKHLYDFSILSRSNIFASGLFNLKTNRVRLSGTYHLESFWKNNYSMLVEVSRKIKKNDLEFSLKSEKKSPEYLFSSFSGNHFKWNNDFDPVEMQTAKLKFTWDKIHTSIEGELNHVSNHIYFDELSTTVQSSSQVVISRLRLFNVIGSRMLKFTTGVVGQFSNSDFIRIPNLYSRNTLAFNFSVRKVPLSLGGIFTYYTSYKGLNYNPAIRHYNLSNSTVGGFPVLDLFFVARVGTADLYVKYDNLFFEAGGRDMFIGENTPLAKQFLHFGLKWKLLK